MNIYFIASISGKASYLKHYQAIVQFLESDGHKVVEHVLHPTEEYVYDLISEDAKKSYYKQVKSEINKADIVIAEATRSSMGVGYEISLAVNASKPVIVLYFEGKSPHFIEGADTDKIVVEKYDEDNLKSVLESCLGYASELQDTRFNFFVSPKHQHYLDHVSKTKKIPRAVFLRKLIEQEMENDVEYNA